MYKFPSIESFSQSALRKALEANGGPLLFRGTVKTHGTSGAIGYSAEREIWCQSRERIITPQSDNYGFAAFVDKNKEEILEILLETGKALSLNFETESLVLYGEWCGEKVQKGVSISSLPRMFVIFDILLVTKHGNRWIDPFSIPPVCRPEINVYSVSHFPSFEWKVSFENLVETRDHFNGITLEVEEECPVGKALGVFRGEGQCTVGEGVVWRAVLSNGEPYRIKIKGEKHTVSKVRNAAKAEVEVSSSLNDFLEKTVTQNRMEQGLSVIFGEEELSRASLKRMGEFQRWVVHDVKKEDMEAFPFLSEYKGEKGPEEKTRVEKSLNKAISKKTELWFKARLFNGQ